MRRSPYFIALIAGAALLISVSVFKRYLPYVGDRLAIRQPPAVVLAMEDVYLVGMNDRTKLWSLNAKKVEIGQDRALTGLSGIYNGRIFDKGNTVLTLNAGRAEYDERREDLRLSGGIRISGTDNQRVAAPQAHWNGRTGVLKSRSRVTASGKWGRASGSELTVDLRKQRMSMRNVSFRISIEELERHNSKGDL